MFRGINTGLHVVNTGLHVASFAQHQEDRQENKANKANNQQAQQTKKTLTSKCSEETHFHQQCVRDLTQQKSEMTRAGTLEMKGNRLRQKDAMREKKAQEAAAKQQGNQARATQLANEAAETQTILQAHEERHQLALDNAAYEFDRAIAHHQAIIDTLRHQQAQINNGEAPAILVDRNYVMPTRHVVAPLFVSSATPPSYNETLATMSDLSISQSPSPSPSYPPQNTLAQRPPLQPPQQPQQYPYGAPQYPPQQQQQQQQPSYPQYPPQQQQQQQQQQYPPQYPQYPGYAQQPSPQPFVDDFVIVGDQPKIQPSPPQRPGSASQMPPKPTRTRSGISPSSSSSNLAPVDPQSAVALIQRVSATGEPVTIRSLYSFAFLSALANGTVSPVGTTIDPSSQFVFVRKDPSSNVYLLRCTFNERKYLRIVDGRVDCDGSGGPLCEFHLISNDDGTVGFRSCKDLAYILAVDESLRTIATNLNDHHYSRKFVIGR